MITEVDSTTEYALKPALKKVFGFDSFRGRQEEIINSILAGKNTFVIMPTGAGKSLCYQLPAIVQPGTAIVISPLIALMKNQVDQMNAVGINAQFLNSTLTKTEMTRVKKEVIKGDVKLLYVAPESLTKEENISFLKQANISFVAIDEAHCISEWGHDFRPEYRRIRVIIDMLGDLPLIALTATATPKVQQDIQKNLNMDEANLFKTSFRRKNLSYEIRPKINAKKALVKYILQRKGRAGIVYCLSRKKTEELAEFLKVNGVRALPYHAGLDANTRMRNQEAFLKEDCEVICATIAFGMGIDKPDVRFVIHYDTPKSLEGYYQETGRGGRDGLPGECLMFFSYADIDKLEKFNKDKSVTERDNARLLLQEMTDYAESGVCRVRQVLHYFGEYMDKDCGNCDNCLKPNEKFKIEEEAVFALQAVQQTGERFDINHIVDVVAGVENDYVKSYSHNKLDVFGKGKDKDAKYWYSIIRQLAIFGFIDKDLENFGALKVSEKGEQFLRAPYPLTMVKDHDFENMEMDEDNVGDDEREALAARAHDGELFELLKGLRKKIAKEKNLPPYVIFQDPSLEEMATVYPTTESELTQITGVGLGKAQKFGKPFLELIKKYVEENDIVTAADVVIKTSPQRSKHKIFIIQQIDRKVDLEEIAESRGITMPELIQEIESICYSGTKLNLSYYLNTILDEERQDEIMDYFMSAESDSIEHAMREFDGEYTEEELRLMRIRFISEVAN
jgi:ATP-dependent DNA helicase RecQ